MVQIDQTNDYGQFKVLPQNRKVLKNHVERLKYTLATHPEATKFHPILVNEDMEVIDGQHRLEALKELGLPVFYVKGEGLTVRDAQILNANQRNWTPIDYAESFAGTGNQNYVHYLEFKHTYKLPHNSLLLYMTGHYPAIPKAETEGPRAIYGNVHQVFRDGKFKVHDIEQAHLDCARLIDAQEVAEGYTSGKFDQAYYSVLHHPNYDHKRFLRQMDANARRFMSKFSNVQDYQRAIERVYNFNRPTHLHIKLF